MASWRVDLETLFRKYGYGKKTKTSQMIQCSIHSKQILLHRSIPGRESDLGRIIGLTSVGPFFMQKRGCWFEVKTFQKVGSRGSLSLPRIKSSSVGQRRSLEDWLVLVFIWQGTAKYKSQLVKSYVNTCRKYDPYAQLIKKVTYDRVIYYIYIVWRVTLIATMTKCSTINLHVIEQSRNTHICEIFLSVIIIIMLHWGQI